MWGTREGREEPMEKKWQLNKDLKREREQARPIFGEKLHKCPEVGTCQACEQKSKEASVSGADAGGKVLSKELVATRGGRWRAIPATAGTWPGRRWKAIGGFRVQSLT